jgi:RecG-like helicase
MISPKFTPNQNRLLIAAQYTSIYDIITTIPVKLVHKYALERVGSYLLTSGETAPQFCGVATLMSIEKRMHGRLYLVLEWQTEGGRILRTFLFSVARFTLSVLQVGLPYTITVQHHKKGMLTLLQYKKSLPQPALGADTTTLSPLYSAKRALTSTVFAALLRRLAPSDFVLDLRGLVPPNCVLLPERFSLYALHFPSSEQDFEATRATWYTFQSYLSLITAQAFADQQHRSLAMAATRDMAFVGDVISRLPYTLSPSQQAAIESIYTSISQPG